MKHSKSQRLLAAAISLTMLGGMMPTYRPVSVLTANAEDNGTDAPETQERENRLKIDGEMTVTLMTPEEIIEAGVDISLEDGYKVFNYEVEMIFEAERVNINRYVVLDTDGVTVSEYIYITPPDSEPILIEKDPVADQLSEPVYIPALGAYISHYETDNSEMYMITYGNSKWLKEFYDVQLIVINKSDKTMENCDAVIDAPDGLTLCNSDQSQNIGTVSPAEVKDIHWYLRADMAGEYMFAFKFTGESGGEEFEHVFCSRNDIRVYAGDALKKFIELPGSYSLDEPYQVKITLKNVSDKPIYGLEHKIKNINEGSVTIRRFNGNGVPYPDPIQTEIQSNNKAEIIHLDELQPGEYFEITVGINDVWDSIIEKELENARLSKKAIVLRSSLSSDSWLKSLDFCSDLYYTYLTEIYTGQILERVGCSAFECSATEIPYELIVNYVSDDLKENNPNYYFRAMSNDAGSYVLENFGENSSEYSSTCNHLIGVFDWESIQHSEQELSEYEKFLKEIWDNGDEFDAPYNVLNECTAVLRQHDWSYSANVKLLDENGEEYDNDSAPFELGVISGNSEQEEDGTITVDGDAVLSIKALAENSDAVVHIEYEDGYVLDYPIHSLKSHECDGCYYVLDTPISDKNGVAVQVCEECGQLISAKYIPGSAVAMLSNGEWYQDISDAIYASAETCEPTTMTLFGDINITTNVTIPDFITTIVAPGAKITVKEGCSLVSAGEVKNFSGNSDCGIMVNIFLNYWEGRTELMRVPVGTVVNSLPDIGTETCPLLSWYADVAHDEEFAPFTAGAEARTHIYWADIHHNFNEHGKCTLCGEFRNGRDAFVSGSVTFGAETELNLKWELTPAAAADKDAIMVFDFWNGTTQYVKMTQAQKNGDGTYSFICKEKNAIIDSSEFEVGIRAEIRYSDGVRGTVYRLSSDDEITVADGIAIKDVFEDDIYYGMLTSEQKEIILGHPITIADFEQISYVDINGNEKPMRIYSAIMVDDFYKSTSIPYLDGYTYRGLNVNGTDCANIAEVVTAVKAIRQDDPEATVQVSVVYEQKEEKYALTISGGHLKISGAASGSFKASTQLYAVADEPEEGMKFSHWRVGDNIVGYETTYVFRMSSKDMTLTAVYVPDTDEIEKTGAGYIESVSRLEDNKLSFVSILSVPDSFHMQKAGIVAQKTDDIGDELTVDNAKFVRFSETSENNFSSFKYTWTLTASDPDTEWSVRPYLVYTDAENVEYTVYGEVVSCSLDEIE